MTHKEIFEQVEEAIYFLIEEGLVEVHGIDEEGNFTYRPTSLGREVGLELRKNGVIE